MPLNSRSSLLPIVLLVAVGMAGCRAPAPEPVQPAEDASGQGPLLDLPEQPNGTAPANGAPAAAEGQAQTQEFRIIGAQMGKSVDSIGKAVAQTSQFMPTDAFYLSVASEGVAQKQTLMVRWSFQTGEVFGNESKTIDANGPRYTEFHVSKTSPWPPGYYKADISLNEVPVQSVEFEVTDPSATPQQG